MAHSPTDFLLGRRFLLASALTSFALPALADLGPDLLKGSIARMVLVKPPKPVPELAFADADDKPLKLADYKGKIVLVNFWATWCAPCVKEMPSLDRLQATLGKDKFLVLPLSLDGPSRPKVVPFYKDKDLANLGIYFDRSKKVMQGLGISILPTSILVDPAGNELGRLEGEADWEKPEAVVLMRAAIGGAS
jgi:thiol-disulfide isomerase/thioredoxin